MEMRMMMMMSAVSFPSSLPKPSLGVNLPLRFRTCSTTTFLKNKGNSRRISTTTRKKGLTCNALFGLGVPELVVIAGVAALVFGPKKLPEVGRSIGKTVKSFQQAAKEFESEIKKESDSTEGAPSEKPSPASEQEEEEKGIKVSSSKETV